MTRTIFACCCALSIGFFTVGCGGGGETSVIDVPPASEAEMEAEADNYEAEMEAEDVGGGDG